METPFRNLETYDRLLSLATAAGHHELAFWQAALAALDDGRLRVDDLPGLIFRKDPERLERPSRATTYRLVEKWRPIVADLRA